MINTDNVQILNGKNVELLCFAQFSLYIHLQGHVRLTVEADFEHIHGDTHEHHLTTFPASESSLIRVLECSVVSATVESNGNLNLVFSNGDSLKISKRPEFESYQLKIGTQELIA
jgi:hypothetical protein